MSQGSDALVSLTNVHAPAAEPEESIAAQIAGPLWNHLPPMDRRFRAAMLHDGPESSLHDLATLTTSHPRAPPLVARSPSTGLRSRPTHGRRAQMTVYYVDRTNHGPGQLVEAGQTTFTALDMQEPRDLEPLLMTNIEAIAPGTMIIENQSSPWSDSNKLIDILAIDKHANLVVIELKRDDARDADLQALRYAAMISNMTFDELTERHRRHLARHSLEVDHEPRQRILEFLGWDDDVDEDDFGNKVRIVIVASDFSKELTTTVAWLLDNNMERMSIECVRLQPYTLNGTTILDIQTVLPLPDISDYQVSLKRKRDRGLAERKERKGDSMDYTKFNLRVEDEEISGLGKGRLIYNLVSELHKRGASLSRIQNAATEHNRHIFEVLEGEIDLRQAFAEIKRGHTDGTIRRDTRRRFLGQGDEVFHEGGKTYVLSNQWGIKTTEPTAKAIIEEFRGEVEISYEAVT